MLSPAQVKTKQQNLPHHEDLHQAKSDQRIMHLQIVELKLLLLIQRQKIQVVYWPIQKMNILLTNAAHRGCGL